MSRAAARSAFDGLSVGDGLGQTFFADREHADALAAISARRAPPAPWRPCSDDTVMASAILHGLERDGRVDQDALAADFARRFALDPERRGYGPMAYWLLHQLAAGRPWREVSPEVFRGQGSLGNGGAMRVAPLGAFFAGDLARVVAEARASAEVTHFHPDGQAGAIAVAVATALLVRGGEGGAALLDGVAARTPEGETRAGVLRARALLGASVVDAAAALGDGRLVRSSDTAPFALWCVARHPRSYEDAVWLALGGLTEPESDRDTTLAIVGGVVGAVDPPPPSWVAAREPLVGPLFEVL